MYSSEERSQYLVGMDLGSTTAKAVVVRSGAGEVLWKDYARHETRLDRKALEFLSRAEDEVGIEPGNTRVFFTGSGGRDLARVVGARFVQEVNAVSLVVERTFPEVRSVIELGGQDSKIIVFKDGAAGNGRKKIAMMNDKCAGGTGAVLDKIAAKLNVPPDRLSGCGYDGFMVHRVASKCGVFAETDINGLQKQGVPEGELLASLFEAIVVQNLTVLTRGHTLVPTVLLLGGPNRFIRGLREAWRTHLPRLWEERGVRIPSGTDVDQLILAPEDGHYFGALGAVEYGVRQDESVGRYLGLENLRESVERGGRDSGRRQESPGLCSSQDEVDDFLAEFGGREARVRLVRSPDPSVFLGVDGGSTSTKAVLLDREGSLLAKAYRLSRGNPIQDAIDLIAELRAQVEQGSGEVEVEGAATTGYAKDVLKKVLGADTAVVETVAHAQSSLHLFRDPEVLVDVGGQDIKLIVLRDGHVKDFMLNTQCSAGNGYFLQSTAESFGMDVEDFARAAFSARKMPEFSYGCAVFLQSDLVDYQRQGWKPEELLAGLAAVLPKNIWLYVAKIANLSTLGTRFVLQGGTQRNLAAVKAQVDYIRAQFRRYGKTPEIAVHPHCGEAGAIGAALEARRLWERGLKTQFPGLKAVGGISYETTTGPETVCSLCKNRCLRTFVDFKVPMNGAGPPAAHPAAGPVRANPDSLPTAGPDRAIGVRFQKDRFIVAGCEKGAADGKASLKAVVADLAKTRKNNPDLTEEAARGVWRSFHPTRVSDNRGGAHLGLTGRKRAIQRKGRESLAVGIPRVLGMYQHAPFFSAYFESLGIPWEHLVFSDFTTDEMFREGSRRGAIDPCFPAKVVVAHVNDLLRKKRGGQGMDLIFNPMVDTHASPMVNTAAANACSTVIAAPQTAHAMFIKEKDVFAEHGVRYLHPILEMSDRKLLARQLLLTFRNLLGLTEEENRLAVEEGFKALSAWDRRIRARGREVLEMLQSEGRLGIVLLGRSYHHDPGLNHGVFKEFQKLGYPVLSQDTLPMDPATLEAVFGEDVREGVTSHPLDVSDVWKHTYIASTAMKLWAAKFVARHPNLVGVELSNFKCGHDAIISQVIQKIIEYAGLPFFSFRDVDENKPAGSFKVRIETIHYFLRRHGEELLRKKTRRGFHQAS